MNTTEILILIVGVLAVLGVVALLISKSRRRDSLPWEDREKIAAPDEAPETEPDTAGAPEEIPSAEEPAPAEPAVPSVDIPESVPSRLQRLRARLARAGGLGQALLSILSRGDLSAADWEEIEETLLMADVGLDATTELLENLRTEVKVQGADADVRAILRAELIKLVNPDMDRSLNLEPGVGEDGEKYPASILMVGVNGTGKTTTTGKLARLLVAEDKTVLLGAADTFRAAAADQLATWGERVGVDVVRSDREGADPASVAFETVKVGRETGIDVVIVDTAGRLQNKSGLMDELGKIKRVMERSVPIREVLLVLDATTGQNGMRQAEVFAEVAGITGIVLTKLDGTAKGGIVISVQRELGVPVKFVGLGEGADDFAPFDVEGFVDSLLA
ncbi:MAG: signal recognition particle-docking protein FtsY [Actinomycetaceae bacterium]|nr:signal recognition particle-docking protein FtsY [Actinomycetaceae bacterium]